MTATALPPRTRRDRAPVLWWLVVVLALLIAAYGLAYVALGAKMYPPHLESSFVARPWGIYPHALFGALSLLLGALQFNRGLLRGSRPRHRAIGVAYVAAATVTGVAGLYMSMYSYGGWTTHLGFGALALALLACTSRAYVLARRRNLVAHREWMLRSYSLIFGAVTLRLWLPLITPMLGGDSDAAYRVIAWASWVPNILWAEWYVRRSHHREAPRVRELGAA